VLKKLKATGFDIMALQHAEAIIRHDLPQLETDLTDVLSKLRISSEELVRGGGGESGVTQRVRKTLASNGWAKQNFVIEKKINGKSSSSTSHEVDHVKSYGDWRVALEIEWNNKDPFYDRDLENFKRLHSEGAISLGVIITRGASLHDGLECTIRTFAKNNGVNSPIRIKKYYKPTDRQLKNIENAAQKVGFEAGWAKTFVSDKFGESTTHWRKLQDRVGRGVGNPCPLLLIGISSNCIEP
jgi:Restriction endonuclease BglII